MPFGRGAKINRAPKHVTVISGEFDDTRQAYLEAVDNHAADAADRHAHVVSRLSVLEQEAAELQALRDRIAAA